MGLHLHGRPALVGEESQVDSPLGLVWYRSISQVFCVLSRRNIITREIVSLPFGGPVYAGLKSRKLADTRRIDVYSRRSRSLAFLSGGADARGDAPCASVKTATPARLQPGRPQPDSSCSAPSTMLNRIYNMFYLIWTCLASTDSSFYFSTE
jgi:hypothetical protein